MKIFYDGGFVDNIIENKSFLFAVRIVKLFKYIRRNKRETILATQLLRAGTSIGANVAESQQAQSRSDFISKLNIALKEAYETDFWLRLLFETQYINRLGFDSIIADCRELEKLLISIIKTSKE